MDFFLGVQLHFTINQKFNEMNNGGLQICKPPFSVSGRCLKERIASGICRQGFFQDAGHCLVLFRIIFIVLIWVSRIVQDIGHTVYTV